ncbi:MAG: phosphoenolpyruvate carboxykinase (ATP), partial [Isosphaeraceae bacterium]
MSTFWPLLSIDQLAKSDKSVYDISAIGTRLSDLPEKGSSTTMGNSHQHATTLEDQGFVDFRPPLWNLSEAVLIEHTLRRGEGMLAASGALVVRTGKYTGRSPKDRFIVKDDFTAGRVDWGTVNIPFEPAHYDALRARVLDYLQPRELYVVDAFGGTDPKFRLPIRAICEKAYHALFAHQLFVRPSPQEMFRHQPEFTSIAAPDFLADPARDHTKTETFIIVNFSRKEVLIGGTLYAGEIKKSIFGVLNTLLPQSSVMPMHCSANVGRRGDVALFFGLSGTG